MKDTEWMPIETAPKDKTIIKLKWGDDDSENVGIWAYSVNADQYAWCGVPAEALILLPYNPQPTHWQPLLASPTKEGG